MKRIWILIFIIGFLFNLSLVKVSADTGAITGSSAYAWGENIGWINFKANGGNITVSDSGLTGYAWSPNYGWINFSPTNGGVTNSCSGILGGYAWSENLGWINFSGITINSDGKFTGIAGVAGSVAGRINFDCKNCSVFTNWMPSCASNSGITNTPVCSATKPKKEPIIISAIPGINKVTLTWSKASGPLTHYLVAYGTRSGSIQFGNPNVGGVDTTSYTIKSLSGGIKYYFRVKAINDCMPGDFSNEVSVTSGGGTLSEPAENFSPVSSIPGQLFDIALIVDKNKIVDASDLMARVTLISFGSEPTPVEMTFTIVDLNGKEYYRSVDKTTIQTEGVFNKNFIGLKLADGKYQVVLNTLYNTNIRDEFKQDFEVGNFSTSPILKFLENKPLVAVIGGIITLSFIVIIIKLFKKRKKNVKYKSKK